MRLLSIFILILLTFTSQSHAAPVVSKPQLQSKIPGSKLTIPCISHISAQIQNLSFDFQRFEGWDEAYSYSVNRDWKQFTNIASTVSEKPGSPTRTLECMYSYEGVATFRLPRPEPNGYTCTSTNLPAPIYYGFACTQKKFILKK